MAFFKKEKVVSALILKHLDMVEDCLKTSIKAGEFYLQDDISQAKVHARKSRSLESEADLIRHDIRDKHIPVHTYHCCARISINWSKVSTRWPMPLKPVVILF